MLKMVLDAMGGVVLTNDGNAILREIDVNHPAGMDHYPLLSIFVFLKDNLDTFLSKKHD
jgi:hypothetical protein